MHAASRYLQEMYTGRTTAMVCIASYANEHGKFKPAEIYTRDFNQVERFLKRYDKPGRAIYHGVYTIIPGKTRSKENVAEITALFADLDFKGIVESRAEIETVLACLSLPATRIVFSGHGLHPYWWMMVVPALRERVEAALKRLAWALAGDPAVCEVARVMRLPGTHNSKDDEWHLVKVIHKNDANYELEQLEAWLAGISEPLLHRKGDASKSNGGAANDDPFAIAAEEMITPIPIDVEEEIAKMRYGDTEGYGVNLTQLRVIGSLLYEGVDAEEAINYVVAETFRLIPESASWSRDNEIRQLRGMCRRTFQKHPELLQLQNGQQQEATLKRPEPKQPPPPVLEWISGEELEKLELEPVQWIVDNFIMRDVLNGMFGDGGTGKDYLLLQLALAMACERRWLGREVTPGKVLYFNVEDRVPRVRWRQHQIMTYLQTTCEKYPDRFRLVPMVGKNTIIATFDGKSGLVKPTPVMTTIRNMIEDWQPDMVIMGNRVNIFGVNQNEDSQARQCIELLNAIGIDYKTTLILPGHVSVRSLGDDSGTSATGSSGSVQWSNGPRHRLLLSKAKKDKEAEDDDTFKRMLSVIKSNDAPTDKQIELHWSKTDFLYVADDEHLQFTPAPRPEPDEFKKDVEREFLRMLSKFTAKKENVSASTTARNNAPLLFSKDAECKYRGDKGKRYLRDAMDRLFASGGIRSVDTGSPSNLRPRIERIGLHVVKDDNQ